jgi:hypothetical protein
MSLSRHEKGKFYHFGGKYFWVENLPPKSHGYPDARTAAMKTGFSVRPLIERTMRIARA